MAVDKIKISFHFSKCGLVYWCFVFRLLEISPCIFLWNVYTHYIFFPGRAGFFFFIILIAFKILLSAVRLVILPYLTFLLDLLLYGRSNKENYTPA